MAFLENVRKQLTPEPTSKAKVQLTSTPKSRRAYIVAGVVVGLTLVVYLVVFLYGQYIDGRVNATDKAIASAKGELTQLAKDNADAQSFSDRLGTLKTIINEHTYFSSVMAIISAQLPKEVQFDSFTLDKESGKVAINARTTTFTQIAKTIVSMKERSEVKEVTLSNLSYSPREVASATPVRFTLTVQLQPAALTTAPVAAKVTPTGSTTEGQTQTQPQTQTPATNSTQQ